MNLDFSEDDEEDQDEEEFPEDKLYLLPREIVNMYRKFQDDVQRLDERSRDWYEMCLLWRRFALFKLRTDAQMVLEDINHMLAITRVDYTDVDPKLYIEFSMYMKHQAQHLKIVIEDMTRILRKSSCCQDIMAFFFFRPTAMPHDPKKVE